MNTRQNEEDVTLDPAAALTLIAREQDAIGKRIGREIPWILLAWGIAWLAGFGLLWLADGAAPALGIPLPVAVIAAAVLAVIATVISAIIGTRAQRGIRATASTAFTGVVYGVSGMVGFVALIALGQALVLSGMAPELLLILYPVGIGLLVGLIHLMGAAIWHAVPILVLGAWTIVVSLAAAFVGAPLHLLVLAVGGGGGYLVAAVVLAVAVRGPRKADA